MKNYTKICNEQLKGINGGGKAGTIITIFDAIIDGWNGFYNAAKNSKAHLGRGPLGGSFK